MELEVVRGGSSRPGRRRWPGRRRKPGSRWAANPRANKAVEEEVAREVEEEEAGGRSSA
jgi:hypothetical protein